MKRFISGLMAAAAVFCAAFSGAAPSASAAKTAAWDGSVDVSWYDPAESEFYIGTPAELAGLAAIINGMTDPTCPKVTGKSSYISCKAYGDVMLVGAGGGNVSDTVYASGTDFAYKTVYLTADLNMGGVYNAATGKWSGPNWTPIGGKYSMKVSEVKGDSLVIDSRFNGVFDGQGHTVSNIYCDRFAEKGFPYSQCVGLIGFLGGSSDLNTSITGEFTGGWQPAVRNVVVGRGYIYGRRMVGGVVGRIGETSGGVIVEYCANCADIHNTDSKGIGGIVGAGWGTGVIRNCYNTGSVTTTYACPAGGICANNEGLDIYNCYNTGTIDSNGQLRGRGIGGHDSGTYTVANCFYLEGCDDDPASNGWYSGSSTKLTLDIKSLTAAEMKSASLTAMLNASGAAFAADTGNINGGFPVLYFQTPGAAKQTNYKVSVSQPASGGKVFTDAEGTVPAGRTVNLSSKADAGYVLKYYTLNGEKLTPPFFTVSADSTAGAVFGKVTTASVTLPESPDWYLAASRTGYKMSGAEMLWVTDEALSSGDKLLEGNVLTLRAAGWKDASPRDMDYEYTDAFTYTAANTVKNADGTFTVTGAGDVAVTVARNTRRKSWLSLADTSWYTGKRSAYTINSGAELAGLAYLVNEEGVTFKGVTISLGKDISLLNTDGTVGVRIWEPIGKNASRAFCGTFDGNGHPVGAMTAYNDGSYAALFGYCSGAVIRNVTVSGTATGTAASSYAAGIAAYASGSRIENCVNRAAVTASGIGAAGIAAYICDGTTVTDCSNRGAVAGKTGVGGIVGISYTAGDKTERCVNYGAVSAAGDGTYGTGGIVGRLAGTVGQCSNYGAVTGGDRYTGGIAGYTTAKNASTVRDSLNAAAVSSSCAHGNASLGGLVGYAQYLALSNCKNSGSAVRGGAFTSANYGDLIGRSETVTEKPLTDESVFLPQSADTGAAEQSAPAGPYKVTFIADGTVVETKTYSGAAVAEPSVPPKTGYSGYWDNYSLGGRDITVRAVYRQNNVRGGDSVTESGTYFLGFYAGGALSVGGGLTVTLDGSNGACDNLRITVGAGTELTLRNVSLSGSGTLLTLGGGILRFTGANALSSVCDIKDNLNPTVRVLGDTEFSGGGSLTVSSGIYNSAVVVAPGATMTLSSGDVTVVKTDMLGMEGGALHAADATVKISGGSLTGRTNSDNVAVVYAKDVEISGGSLRLQAERSPYAVQAARVSFTGGTVYAAGNSGNSASVSRAYRGREAVSGLSGTVGGAFSPVLPFTDVSVTDDWFGAVFGVYQTGYFTGTSDTTFSPNSTMTRAMLVTVLYRMAGEPAVSGKTQFTDTPSEWYRAAVLWAGQTGITEGTTATTFSPNKAVTAEQAAAFLARFATFRGFKADGAGVPVRGASDWAQNDVSWALKNDMLPAGVDYTAVISRALLAKAVAAYGNVY
ncbi:MAG: S-layer homology domain-containing protein [Oscillospiraceae bacterium]|jgi:hypothetical protein|nr:S-layer homology domain-containing protein [Oscillospiraceae bacterium]